MEIDTTGEKKEQVNRIIQWKKANLNTTLTGNETIKIKEED